MDDFLKDFRDTVERGAEAMRRLDEEAAARPLAPGKWSPKEVVGHLIDSATHNRQRFQQARRQDDLCFPGYDQDSWVAGQRYQEAPWPELIELWRLLNLQLARSIEALPEDVLRRPRERHNLHQVAWRPVPESEAATLEYFVRDYLGHMRHHLVGIMDPGGSG